MNEPQVPHDVFLEAHRNLPRQSPGRDEYTRKAFHMLPPLHKPRILDIGCGSGTPTMELARLSDGEITGIDILSPMLDEFSAKIRQAGLSHRVKAVNCSMFSIDFADETFDIVWAEGSIYNIGFDRGLREWRRLLKPGGFMVVHEAVWLRPNPPTEIRDYWMEMYPGIRSIEENLSQIAACDYELAGHFPLPDEAWWVDYYGPLEQRLSEMRLKYADDPAALEILAEEQKEIDMFREYGGWYGSAFFVMRKRCPN